MIPTQTPVEPLWHEYRHSPTVRLRNQLAQMNDKLALKIAHRLSSQSPEPIDDITQICRIGLLKAVERYDPQAGAAFSSFAVPYVQGEFLHWQRDKWGHLKIPRRAFEDANKVKNTCIKLESMGRKVDRAKVAEAYGMSAAKWQWTSEAVQRKPLTGLDDSLHFCNDDCNEHDEQAYTRLKQAIARLPRLKRQCVEELWFKGLSEQAIARRHKLTLVAVQGILREAIEQLKLQLQEV